MPATGQEWIFISYRRKGCRDEAHALAARLRERIHHGAVFLDEPGIDLGDDFDQRLRQAVSSALVVIVVIGKGWPQTFADRARDLRPPQVDYVRLELAAALERARRQPPQCVLIPWLVGGATMPTDAELAAAGAAELGDLARRQAGSGDFAHAPLSPGDPTERLLERIDRAAAELLGDHRLSRAHAQDAVHALLRGFEADPGLKGIASLFNEQGVADMLRDSPSDAIARLGYIAQKAVPRSAKAIQRQHLRQALRQLVVAMALCDLDRVQARRFNPLQHIANARSGGVAALQLRAGTGGVPSLPDDRASPPGRPDFVLTHHLDRGHHRGPNPGAALDNRAALRTELYRLMRPDWDGSVLGPEQDEILDELLKQARQSDDGQVIFSAVAPTQAEADALRRLTDGMAVIPLAYLGRQANADATVHGRQTALQAAVVKAFELIQSIP